MVTRLGVALRPVLPGDHVALRAMELSPGNTSRWRFAGEVPSPEAYLRSLWSGVLEQRVVTTTASPEPIGLVNAHRADLRSGTAWLGVVEDENRHGQGVGVAGLVLFIDWLFDHWPLRHLHAEVDEANLAPFRSVLDGYAVVAGRLTARFVDARGERDAVLLSIDRERWVSTVRSRVRAAPRPGGSHRRISLDEVCAIAAGHGADVRDVGPDTPLSALGLDSLAIVVVLDELEQCVGAPLPASERPLLTLGDLLDLVRTEPPSA